MDAKSDDSYCTHATQKKIYQGVGLTIDKNIFSKQTLQINIYTSRLFNRQNKNLVGKGVVRKRSSPQRVASLSNLCNSRRQGTWATGSVAASLGKQVCPFISGKSSMTGDPLKA